MFSARSDSRALDNSAGMVFSFSYLLQDESDTASSTSSSSCNITTINLCVGFTTAAKAVQLPDTQNVKHRCSIVVLILQEE